MFTKAALDIENSLYHATNEESLKRILDAGHIKTLKHVAQEDPTRQLSVELSPVPIRVEMPASKAVDALSKVKTVDKVFFTRGGILPNYGNYIIAKGMNAVKDSPLFNSIPNEVVTPRKVSVRRKAKIFIPDDEITQWRSMYPHMKNRFQPRSEFQAKTYGITDRAKALYAKLTKTSSTVIPPRVLSSNAILGGSEGLGLNTDNSDTDIFIPYKTPARYTKAIERIASKYPELQQRKSTLNNTNKTTFTGNIKGKEVDVVLGVGDKAQNFYKAYLEAKHKLTPEQRQEIIKTKRRLKNSWFFPETRYKRYKNQLASELGLKQHYF